MPAKIVHFDRADVALPSGRKGFIEFTSFDDGTVLVRTGADYFPAKTEDRLFLQRSVDEFMAQAGRSNGIEWKSATGWKTAGSFPRPEAMN